MNSAFDFPRALHAWQARMEYALDTRLPPDTAAPARLHAAMRYSTLASGKRVRPALVFATATALGLAENSVEGAACAVEMIHAYSLIHDDLPAMDDDDLRRGRPTCHKAFDEATAILAGDALQVLAFEILAGDPSLPPDPAIRLRLIELLAKASGTAGMAGGQALDLAAEGKSLRIDEVVQIHSRKTGALIAASVMMAAACAKVSGTTHTALRDYADSVGLAFQIQDDLLDIEGDPQLLGKAVGADQAHGKPTYPATVGIESAKRKLHELHRNAFAALQPLGANAAPLAAISDWLLLRKY